MLLKGYKVSKLIPIYAISIGKECEEYIIKLADQLRSNHIPVSVELKGKIQKRMEKALKNDADYIIFAGQEEMQNNIFKLKMLRHNEEKILSSSELINFFSSIPATLNNY